MVLYSRFACFIRFSSLSGGNRQRSLTAAVAAALNHGEKFPVRCTQYDVPIFIDVLVISHRIVKHVPNDVNCALDKSYCTI